LEDGTKHTHFHQHIQVLLLLVVVVVVAPKNTSVKNVFKPEVEKRTCFTVAKTFTKTHCKFIRTLRLLLNTKTGWYNRNTLMATQRHDKIIPGGPNTNAWINNTAN
jgi:hypothetical protein